MKKRVLVFCVLIALVFSACQSATSTPAPTDVPVVPTALPVIPTAVPTEVPTLEPTVEVVQLPILELVTPTETLNLTLADIEKLPATTGMAGIKSSTGKITPPMLFTGVSLKDLADLAAA